MLQDGPQDAGLERGGHALAPLVVELQPIIRTKEKLHANFPGTSTFHVDVRGEVIR